MRITKASAFLACAAIAAIGVSGCSGGGSTPPLATAQSASVSQMNVAQPGIAPLSQQPPVGMQIAFLMTDGTVLTQSNNAHTWYKYTPSIRQARFHRPSWRTGVWL